MAVFQPIRGVPTFNDENNYQGIAPTGYAPGTMVKLLGDSLVAPQLLQQQPVSTPAQPNPVNVFQPLMDENGFDGIDESFGGSQQSGSGNIATDLGIPSALTDPIVDFGLNFMNPTPLGLGLSALGRVVPGLAPLGVALSAANAMGDVFGAPQTNSLGQTQQSGVGNETVDMFGNLVGSPENIASVASFNPNIGSFVGPTGEVMGPAPNPDVGNVVGVNTPGVTDFTDFSSEADAAQAADTSGAFGDSFGESTAAEMGFDDGVSSGGDGGGDGSKVICTELHRQRKLDDATMAADKEYGEMVAEHDPHTMAGYHLWAKPVVRLMQKSKIITWIVALLALPWAREMLLRQTGNGRGSWRGRILMRLGIPLCRFLGRRTARGWLPPFRSEKNA
tara:strand:+ start:1924 stop:3096 length:1173 start_codon:yes stop_codon:yes gene_type:complete